MNRTKQGAKLEIYVEELFKGLCKLRVKRNVVYTQHGLITKRRKRAQIDVEYWDLGGKTIVECKYYSNNVPKEDVEEFYQRSRKVRHNQRMMITNKGYTKGAEAQAKKRSIKLVDGMKLKKLDYGRLSMIGMVMDQLGRRKSLEDQIKDVDLRKYGKYHSARRYTI